MSKKKTAPVFTNSDGERKSIPLRPDGTLDGKALVGFSRGKDVFVACLPSRRGVKP